MKSLRIVSLVLFFNLFEGQLAWPNPLTKIHRHRADGGFGGLGNMGAFGNPGGFPAGGGAMSGLGSGGVGNFMGAASSTGSESTTDECTRYKIVSARGTGELQGGTTVSSGYVSGVLAAVPGGAKYDVQYPASMDYMEGPAQGAADAMKYITQQNSRCPKQLYVLNGYSEGAMVVTELMSKLQISPSLIVSIVLYGNPFFKGGAPQDACASKTGSGIAAAMGTQMPSQYTPIVFDCCAVGDMICQAAGSMVAHMSYAGSQDQKNAVAFATGKLQSALSGGGQQAARPATTDTTNTGYGGGSSNGIGAPWSGFGSGAFRSPFGQTSRHR